MEYTGRQVLMSVREREDGAWRFAVWMRRANDTAQTHPFEAAWKDVPLAFDNEAWLVEGIIANALRYVKHVNENTPVPPDQDALDLWGDV